MERWVKAFSGLYDAIHVLHIAKEVDPGIITLLGGIHPTFCWGKYYKKKMKL